MAITSVKTGSSFTNLQKYNQFLGPNSAYIPSSFESIATVTITSTSSTVEFTSIPQTYSALQIRGIAKIDMAGYAKEIYCRLNNDTSANYGSHVLYGDGSNAQAAGPQGTSFMRIAYAGAMGSSPTNQYGTSIIDIQDYTSTTKKKTLRSFSGADANAGGGFVALGSGLWLSTSAVTSITLLLDSANFTSGTSFALYGIKGA